MKQIIQNNNGTFKVLNTKGTDYYLINLSGHCSCMGFGYRRKCRHVDLLKKKGLISKDGKIKQSINKGFACTQYIPKFIHDKKGFRVELIKA